MDITILKEAGLTEGEIKVYLALLELGSSTTGPIIEHAGVARSFIYNLLEGLIEKGLVSFVIQEKTNYYQASEPKKLLEYIDERKQQIEENKKKVEQLLPQLELKRKTVKETQVRVYKGFKGLATAHEHTYNKLKKGEKYYYIAPGSQPKTHHLYWQRDHLRRIKAGLKSDMLVDRHESKEMLRNRNSFKGSDVRYMPSNMKLPAYYMVYKDTTVLYAVGEKTTAIEIIDQNIADSFKAFFNEFWKKSKKFTG